MRSATGGAHGRVNLMGEHTDYHQGLVLPTVIPQRTLVEVRPRHDRTVNATSRETGNEPQQYVVGEEAVTGSWIDYVQGVTFALRPLLGDTTSGFDLRIESDVPLGSGLSSSAALEVSVLRALRELWGLPLDDIELAKVAQRAETDFVNAPVGIMDQMACSVAREGEALLLDTRSLSYQRVRLPQTVELVVINSGMRHQHASGGYTTRRKESFDAAARLGVAFLRDLDVSALARINALPELWARRARHVVTENQRVRDTADALMRGDVRLAGALFYASHDSMRDDYQISTNEIDTLVALGRADPDVYGARLTGGGFGGSVVMLVRPTLGGVVGARILGAYHRRVARSGTVLVPTPVPPSPRS